MRNPISVAIPGVPEAQGSSRAFVVGGRARITSDNPRLKSWRRDAMTSMKEAKAQRPTLHGPCEVVITFWFPRPKQHFGTGRNANRLKPTSPILKTSKPDIDKLVRAVLDAGTGAGLWVDDSQVCELRAFKVYAAPNQAPGVDVVVLAGEWDQLVRGAA